MFQVSSANSILETFDHHNKRALFQQKWRIFNSPSVISILSAVVPTENPVVGVKLNTIFEVRGGKGEGEKAQRGGGERGEGRGKATPKT